MFRQIPAAGWERTCGFKSLGSIRILRAKRTNSSQSAAYFGQSNSFRFRQSYLTCGSIYSPSPQMAVGMAALAVLAAGKMNPWCVRPEYCQTLKCRGKCFQAFASSLNIASFYPNKCAISEACGLHRFRQFSLLFWKIICGLCWVCSKR